MKFTKLAALTLATLSFTYGVQAQEVAGSSRIGIAVFEVREVTMGLSAKHQILGKDVFNEKMDLIGRVGDLVISQDKAVSYAIIDVGGFLGIASRQVAIPVNQFTRQDGKFVLAGATQAILKEMPRFEYAY